MKTGQQPVSIQQVWLLPVNLCFLKFRYAAGMHVTIKTDSFVYECRDWKWLTKSMQRIISKHLQRHEMVSQTL